MVHLISFFEALLSLLNVSPWMLVASWQLHKKLYDLLFPQAGSIYVISIYTWLGSDLPFQTKTFSCDSRRAQPSQNSAKIQHRPGRQIIGGFDILRGVIILFYVHCARVWSKIVPSKASVDHNKTKCDLNKIQIFLYFNNRFSV